MKSKCFGIWFLIVIFCATIVAACLYNPMRLHALSNDFSNYIRKANVEIIEVQSKYGKLNGSGNGVQFFVAVLVKAEQEKMEILIAQLEKKYDYVGYMQQNDSRVDSKYLEHGELCFNADIKDGNYYMVYLYETRPGNPLDVKGH